MTGEHANNKRCPVCGGRLEQGEATIPYVLKDGTVVVVKQVPAEICGDCREPFTTSAVTARLTELVRQLRDLHSEVSVVPYREVEIA